MEATIERDQPICDFCSSPDVKWRYPAKDFKAWEVDGVQGQSVGDWAACDICHSLIEANNRDGLEHRTAITQEDMPDDMPDDALRAMIHHIHDGFWSNRKGPPIEHDWQGGHTE